MTTNLVRQLNDFGKLIVNKDTVIFADKIYPKLVTLIGGKDKIIEMTVSGYEQLAKENMSIDSVIFLKPNPIIETDDELQTTITEVIVMTIPEGKMITKSTIIAISQDGGNTWYFMDSPKELKEMQKAFPNLSDQLIVAPQEKPAIFRN